MVNLMRSETGNVAYLSSFKDPVFKEVKDFFEKNEKLCDMNKMAKVKIFHNIFGVVCDPAPDNTEYQIGRDPICPKCHMNNNLSWHYSNPPEIIDVQVNSVTHDSWNKLTEMKKNVILNNAIRDFLNKNKLSTHT